MIWNSVARATVENCTRNAEEPESGGACVGLVIEPPQALRVVP